MLLVTGPGLGDPEHGRGDLGPAAALHPGADAETPRAPGTVTVEFMERSHLEIDYKNGKPQGFISSGSLENPIWIHGKSEEI